MCWDQGGLTSSVTLVTEPRLGETTERVGWFSVVMVMWCLQRGALGSAVVTKMGRGPVQEPGAGFGGFLSVPGVGVHSICPKALSSHPGWAEERAEHSSNTGPGSGALLRALEARPHHTSFSELPSVTAQPTRTDAHIMSSAVSG